MADGYAALWDMDGTLVDTAEMHFVAWRELCAELGRDFTRADFAATFGRRNPEIFRILFGDRFGPTEMAELGERKEERYRAAVRVQGVTPLPGVAALLAGLKAVGFSQAIGTSAPRGNADLILELTGLQPYFAAVVSMEDTQRGKPDPQVFQVGAAKLGVDAKRCVVFEDASAGVEAARAGGMKCIAVTFVGHHPEAELRAAGADRVVRTLEEVQAADVQRLFTN